ncbi:PTS system, mannose-specific IID component [Atopostipes suicloacalis DSM 15692]|uniref:PTS system, mannose-specific IID component n=1 Tax=Atopostipes suicloacalis DSM 15692 TaxID=1121025 RepID=A0A1M4YIT9_9LACT|nr:PTS system mannose/fructose/sorbose family transporter subunit IID [Atopostipes suicloacalis]SHF05538.1 PTS system, mannose-specific IID component [Atopostipes suicloacalis DSM 15692]
MSEQDEKKRVSISKRDRMNVSWRLTFVQANWNYERMHNVGFAYTLAPIIRKLYSSKEDRRDALKRHLEFVNTHPYVHAPIVGVVLALEEEKANGAEIDDMAIQGVKVGMMGPLAGVGDPIFWGTLRPVIGAFAASLALTGSALGPLLFFLIWNVIRILFTWYTQELGYVSGSEITKELGGGILRKLTTGASILGMFVMGVLVPRWTEMNFPVVISELQNDADTIVDFEGLAEMANNNILTADKLREVVSQLTGGGNLYETTAQTLGDIFNELLPGLMPLILTLVAMYLMKNKNVSAITLIFAIFGLGIVMYALGIMG